MIGRVNTAEMINLTIGLELGDNMSWQDILKKDPRRAKKARKKRKKKKRSPYTNPKLRAKVVAEAKAKVFGDGQGGNASGKWSGRKAQWAAREYKKRGGGYR